MDMPFGVLTEKAGWTEVGAEHPGVQAVIEIQEASRELSFENPESHLHC